MKLVKHSCLCALGLSLLVYSHALVDAQSPAAGQPRPHPDIMTRSDQSQAAPTDVSSIQNIVKAFYSAISAPAGGKLDRTRLQSLFVPSGRIAFCIAPDGSHPADVVFLSPDQYADGSDMHTAKKQTGKEGFFDSTSANQIGQFGVMAHVYSTYKSRSDAEDAKPMAPRHQIVRIAPVSGPLVHFASVLGLGAS